MLKKGHGFMKLSSILFHFHVLVVWLPKPIIHLAIVPVRYLWVTWADFVWPTLCCLV